jgi:hypothetical protein
MAITSEEEKKNCCFDGPIIALLIIQNVKDQVNTIFSLIVININDAIKLTLVYTVQAWSIKKPFVCCAAGGQSQTEL